jgi:hypothetical protein
MEKLTASLLLFITTITMGLAQDYININCCDGKGIRFWNGNDGFKISMGSAPEYQLNPTVTSFSIRTTMDNLAGRGWTWGLAGSTTNVAAINVNGDMKIAGTFKSKNLSVGTPNYDYVGTGDLGAIGFPRGEIIFATSHTQNQLYITSNGYYAPGGFRYRSTAPVIGLGFDDGNANLFSAPSGTAETAIPITSRMFIANTGNVGIGTTTPAYKLDVAGTINATSILVNGQPISSSGGSSQWATNGNNISYVPGFVGIGTTSPTQKLEVNGSILQNAENTAFGVDNIGDSRLGFIKKAEYAPVIASSSGAPIVFSQTNQPGIYTNIAGATLTERMRIDANGHVGIGSANPIRALHVNGELSVTRADKNAFINVSDPNGNGGGTIWLRGLTNGGSAGTDATIMLHGSVAVGSTTPPIRALQVNGELSVTRADKQAFINVSDVNGNGGGTIWLRGLTDAGRVGTDATILLMGNVGIGTTAPDAKLAVKGQIHAQEVKIDLNGAVAPDYVFEPDYHLKPLSEIETYIKANKHLPEVPSAKEMEANGVQLGEMNMLLLKKVEELTLYVIELKKRDEEQQKEIEELRSKK